MILFLGEKNLFDYIKNIHPDITYDIGIEAADKLIVSESTEAAAAAVRAAILINLPVLGILDGYQVVCQELGGRCETIDTCAEGKQEWAVVDVECPIYKGLESVIKICRGRPVAIIESTMPQELDCISRAESGEIIAVRSLTASNVGGNVYAINYYPASELTPAGENIIKNFINLQKEQERL